MCFQLPRSLGFIFFFCCTANGLCYYLSVSIPLFMLLLTKYFFFLFEQAIINVFSHFLCFFKKLSPKSFKKILLVNHWFFDHYRRANWTSMKPTPVKCHLRAKVTFLFTFFFPVSFIIDYWAFRLYNLEEPDTINIVNVIEFDTV